MVVNVFFFFNQHKEQGALRPQICPMHWKHFMVIF